MSRSVLSAIFLRNSPELVGMRGLLRASAACGGAAALSVASAWAEERARVQSSIPAVDSSVRFARTRRQAQFVDFVRTRRVGEAVGEAMRRGDEKALAGMQSEIAAHQERILFDAEPGERDAYMRRWGCAAWTDGALVVCAEHSPLIELGAGQGRWAEALSATGADIRAYDDFSAVPLHMSSATAPARAKTPLVSPLVARGDVSTLAEPEARGRTLLLVYPPDGPMARNALKVYTGERLLYVGEGRGGYNADEVRQPMRTRPRHSHAPAAVALGCLSALRCAGVLRRNRSALACQGCCAARSLQRWRRGALRTAKAARVDASLRPDSAGAG